MAMSSLKSFLDPDKCIAVFTPVLAVFAFLNAKRDAAARTQEQADPAARKPRAKANVGRHFCPRRLLAIGAMHVHWHAAEVRGR